MAVDPRKYALICVLLSAIFFTCQTSEQGKWSKALKVNRTVSYVAVYKTLFNNSDILLSITCGEKSEGKMEVNWMLRWSPCAEEYLEITNEQVFKVKSRPAEDFYFIEPNVGRFVGMKYLEVEYVWATPKTIDCTDKTKQFLDFKSNFTTANMFYADVTTTPEPAKEAKAEPKAAETGSTAAETGSEAAETGSEAAEQHPDAPTNKGLEENKEKNEPPGRKRRAGQEQSKKNKNEDKPTAAAQPHPDKTPDKGLLSRTWRDGVFLFILQVKTEEKNGVNITVDIGMKNSNGYLSAMERPLLIFFEVMCVVYVVLGLVWLVLLACNWRDLLRVQFWIGGVIVLGMLEKAVFYAEYQNINSKGESVPGAVIFAELVSCVKRTVARMLVIIVSLGFGIVKPRLGPMLHKVLGVGSLYFIFAAVEGCYRTVKAKSDQSSKLILVAVPLALIDAIICWWIFSSLVQTLRTLRLRRNIVKLSLYRHFTNTLVFAVLASIAFMVWSYTQHRLKICLTDWKELWVDDAYWHLLFSVILVVIMVLWRPTINNQRYAFSPLLDAADDEADEDIIMSDTWDGIKMRGARNGSPRQSAASKAEDDLKWVEENIPSSIIDKALPVIDSDEEIVTTKLEMAKME